jgi:agmatine deiminase
MWKIVSEQSLHRQTWMAYPWDRYIWGSHLAAAQRTITHLVRTISFYETVCLLVPPRDEKPLSKRFGSGDVKIIPTQYNDVWVRDTLPTFAVGSDNSLIAIDWHFNGWGKTPGLPYRQDVKLSRLIARIVGANLIATKIVAEGGAFTFDGQDTIVATQSVMLHSERNGTHDQNFLQDALLRGTQCKSVCWLPGDKFEPISRGHADAILTFANHNTVLFHWIEDEQSQERKVCERNLHAFKRWMEKERRKYDIIKLSSFTSSNTHYCTSYVNFVHVNGATVVPVHGGQFSKFDDRALGIIREIFGKPAAPVAIRDIAAYGGGIHCCTQQEPLIA